MPKEKKGSFVEIKPMELNNFCIFTSFAALLFKFFYGKSISINIKIIIRSYLSWFDIYDIINTYDLKLKSFYRISNICNLIVGLAFCILVIDFIFSLSLM
jgi:hypothetical protein